MHWKWSARSCHIREGEANIPSKLFSYATGEPVNTVEMHVLARAYRAAWRSVHAREPANRHVIPGVDLIIDFGEIGLTAAVRRPGPPGDDVDRDGSGDQI
jgi:hypothetical protein